MGIGLASRIHLGIRERPAELGETGLYSDP
jgi:hypothetical protein